MSGWRAARSLDRLRDEIDQAAPGRSKRSDGTIGDAAHAGGASDHNPNPQGVVCARDFTHDPGSGADMHRISRQIVTTLPPALKYVIWNKQIWSRARASEGWRRYTGSNPHTQHMHVSVGRGPDGQSTGPYDDNSAWGVLANGGTVPRPSVPSRPDSIEEIVMALPTISSDAAPTAAKKRAQSLLAANGYPPANTFDAKGRPDGRWGPGSVSSLKQFQKDKRVRNSVLSNGQGDGVLGDYSWAALLGV